MERVLIAAAVRTPVGSFCGQFSSLSAPELASVAIKEALNRSKISPDIIDEVFLGHVLSANVGQLPAKQAALLAHIPASVPCSNIGKVCSSGMKAVMIGAMSILSGQNQIVVAGGMESMSNCPFYSPEMRSGAKYGHKTFVDGVQRDGLTDAANGKLMGECAEITAEEYQIGRKEQDDFCNLTYTRAINATKEGKYEFEICPVPVKSRKGEILIKSDEELSKFDPEKMKMLKPVFKENGTITPANGSSLNDGASVLILISESKAKELGITSLAQIIAFDDGEQKTEKFTTSPSIAIPKVLKRSGLSIEQIDYFEINEAFSVVALVNAKILNIPIEKLNVYGGSVALGHPLGSSGARIITTLISILHQEGGKIGCAAICNGMGGASSIIISKC